MLRLEQNASLARPLSMSEYYHASLGITGGIVQPVEGSFIFEGEGPDFVPEAWQAAIDRACAANPGGRLRLVGRSWFARWETDGRPPGLRVIEHVDWDGMSDKGADFIRSVPLSVDHGPTVEFVLVNHSPRGRLVIMRLLHAVMDGRGSLHFLAEVFRALRGEPLLGTNAPFSDVDLMQQVSPATTTSGPIRTGRLTGAPEGDEPGDEWRRVTLRTSGRNIVGRTAAALAEFMHRHSDMPALFTVAVDLRRHFPGLISTANFFGVLFVPLNKGEGADDFQHRLRVMLDGRMEAYFFRIGKLFKLLPRRWIDRILERSPSYNIKKRPLHTAGISNVGRIDPDIYSFDGFRMRSCFVIPLQGTNVTVMGVDDRVEMALNIPKVFASDGRFDALIAHLRQRLEATDPT